MKEDKDFIRKDIIFGRNAIVEAMEGDRSLEKILVSDTSTGSIKKIIAMAKEKKIIVDRCEKKILDKLSNGGKHQGILGYVTEFSYSEIEDILNLAKDRQEPPFLVILDGVTDPHNLGAIMRTAEACGVHGIIIPKRRAVGVNDTVVKSSAGASEYMKVAKVTNLNDTIKKLQDQNIWVYSCNMNGENVFKTDFSGGVALVLGSEGKGVSKGVEKSCDFVVSIPMKGKINSLNVSNAGSIAMYQVFCSRV